MTTIVCSCWAIKPPRLPTSVHPSRAVSTEEEPLLIVTTGKGSQVRKAKFKIAKMVDVMGWKAVGAKLVDFSKNIMMELEIKEEAKTQAQLF